MVGADPVSYTHLDVYKRQFQYYLFRFIMTIENEHETNQV